MKITFDDSAKKDVLSILDKTVRDDGIIIEKKSREPVLTTENEELHIRDFGGVQKGSEIFIKKDLISLMRLVKR